MKMTTHINFIGHEINESLDTQQTAQDRSIFCKKLHVVTEPMAKDCTNCHYFVSMMQGNGIECEWVDETPDGSATWLVEHKDVNKELYRVSKLIDQGVIKKG